MQKGRSKWARRFARPFGMSITQLEALLRENVVQVLFTKRTNGMPRHMLCTTCRKFLNSRYGKRLLHFVPPKGGPRYYAHAYNNIIVWDIHKQAFRTVCCDDFIIERIMTPTDFRRKFWPSQV